MRADDDDDDDGEVKDGESVRVPIFLCDGVRRAVHDKFAFDASMHQPGFRTFADAGIEAPRPGANADKAYSEYKKRISEAWKTLPTATPFAVPRADYELAERVAALLALGRPSASLAGPQLTDPRFRPSRVSGGADAADARKAADGAYDQMVERLTNAWRSPT